MVGKELDKALRYLNTHGALEDYNALNKTLNDMQTKLERLNEYQEILRTYKKKLKDVQSDFNTQNNETDSYIENIQDLLEEIMSTFRDLSKSFYEKKPGGIKIINNNSVAIYKNIAYFSDNGGGVHALDIIKKQPLWSNNPFDDTDATIVIDEEKENPYIYSGSEIDKQGSKGVARIQKLNGLDGSVMWEKKIPGFSLLGDSPVNGGVLGTPIIGEGPLKGQVIYNISRFKTFNGGLLISLDKETGEEVWRWEMPNYSWSSTVAVYTDNGKAYFVQADSVGNIFLLNESGKVLHSISLGANIEASPIVVDNQIIVATRGGQIYKVNIH